MAATTIKGFDIDGATRQIDYEALANKPTIPTTVAELIDASNYVTSAYVESMISASTEIPFFFPYEEIETMDENTFEDILATCDELAGYGKANSGASASVLTFFNIWKDAPSFYIFWSGTTDVGWLAPYGYGGVIDNHFIMTFSADETTTVEVHYFSLNWFYQFFSNVYSGHPFKYKAIAITFQNGELALTAGVPMYSNAYLSTDGYNSLPITSIALQSALTKSSAAINMADYYKILEYYLKYLDASFNSGTVGGHIAISISEEDYNFLYSIPEIFILASENTFHPYFNVHDITNSSSNKKINYLTISYSYKNKNSQAFSGHQLTDIYYYKTLSGSSFVYSLWASISLNGAYNYSVATKESGYSLSFNNKISMDADRIPFYPVIEYENICSQPYMWTKNSKDYFSLNGISYEYNYEDNISSAVPIQSSVAQPLLNYTFTLNTGGTFDAPDSGIINDIIFKAINPSKSNLMIKVVSGSSAYWFNSFGYDSGTGIIYCDTYVPNLSSNLTLNIDSAGTGTLTMTQEKKHTQTITLNGGTVDLSCGDNVTYVASDLVSACTITCEQTPKTDGIENVVIFKTSEVTPSITISGGNCTMVWANNDVPSFKASKIYEVRATINDLGGTKYCMLAYAEYKAS